jgi:hypothetical protein
MTYNVLTIPPFDKQFKRLVKKYPSLKQEFIALVARLEQDPQQGIALGNSCFKIRLAIHSKGKGKRSGGRVITHFVISDHSLFLIAIYDKSEVENLTDGELKMLLSNIQNFI